MEGVSVSMDVDDAEVSAPPRPYHRLGAPQPPLPFPNPHWEQGKRGTVLCFMPKTGREIELRNVLYRDFSREYPDDAESHVQQAYWPMPHKKPIKTIMGHVEICYLLHRYHSREQSTRTDLETDSSDDGEEDYEEEVIFSLTDTLVAVKVNYHARMMNLRDRHAEDPRKEIAAMQLIGNDSPHVLGCMDALAERNGNVNVVLRYCNSGDLFELLQESRNNVHPGMSEERARYWFRQIVAGLQFLRQRGVCHRDLSPENVMIDGGTLSLIIDFGMCLRVPYLDAQGNVVDVHRGTRRCLITSQGACGKLPYMSPEIYDSSRHPQPFDAEAIDIFSTGTILFCMITGNRSFERPHASDPQFYWMTHGLEQLLSDWQVSVSPECLHLMKGMLQVDPRRRLTLEEIVQHAWIAGPVDPPSEQERARR